jgi:hypothetical protein
MPTLEGGERTGHCGAIGPILAVPFVALGPADEIEQLATRYRVMDEMRPGPNPRLVSGLEFEIGQPFEREQSAIGHAARQDWTASPGQHCAPRRLELPSVPVGCRS